MGILLNRRDLRGDLCLKHCKGGEYILIQRISFKGDPHWLYARYTHNDVVDFPLSLDGRLTSVYFDFFIRPEEMFSEVHDTLKEPRFSMIQDHTKTNLYKDFVLSEFYKNLRNWWFTATHTETGDIVRVNGDGTYTYMEPKLKPIKE